MDNPIIDELTYIFGNESLAIDVYNSIDIAVDTPFVELGTGKKVWNVFERSLNAAIRDIENHPRGILFRRLVEYGANKSDELDASQNNTETVLSDEECGVCLEFIHSHIVTRFKGELAELLALKQCIRLLEHLSSSGDLSPEIRLYWADEVQERWCVRHATSRNEVKWGNFTKGADGIVVRLTDQQNVQDDRSLSVYGVIEVKSVRLSVKRILAQVDRHISRLSGGLCLGGSVWLPELVNLDKSSLVRIIVLPATSKLKHTRTTDRIYGNEDNTKMELVEPYSRSVITELRPGVWSINLGWSQEALDEAAYTMTYWYMSQVGAHVGARGGLPTVWDHMGYEGAGTNALKEALYYMMLRPITPRQQQIAKKLYNIFCFSYSVGVASTKMLWSD